MSVRRREFIAGLGSAAAWPLGARAQQPRGYRRIGVLTVNVENDPVQSPFKTGLDELGWSESSNLRMDIRWAAGSVEKLRIFAKELVELRPEVILSGGTLATEALHRETRTIPIVFVQVSDPIGAGFVQSLPRPGGNLTGFIANEAAMAGKWLELLMEIAPNSERVGIIFNPETAPGGGSYFLQSFEASARSVKVAIVAAPVHNDPEIEMAIDSLGGKPRGGLIAMLDGFTVIHRAAIIASTARNNVPAVYWGSSFVRDGGLLSYGPDVGDIYHRAAAYVDRILRGALPAELPVQLPIKFLMALNAKTAKALGLVMPPSILLRADEVIE
jgi:putative ABC transport system substrate-binding protein